MVVAYRSNLLRRRSEIVAALLLAIGMLGILLFLAAIVVLWDVRNLQSKVGERLEIDIDRRPDVHADTTYARETAERMSREILRGHQARLFAPPDGSGDAPGAKSLPPAASSGLPSPAENEPPPPSPRNPRQLVEASSAPDPVTASLIPVLALRKVPAPAARPGPDLGALYESGRIGSGQLGRPGETAFQPKPLEMPAAPSSQSLAPTAPVVTPFVLSERVAEVSRRLVEERPPQGYPSLDDDIEAFFTVYRAPGAPEAYFRLDIRLRPESWVGTIPKDVLFLIDISQSISLAELKVVREAVIASLRHLGKSDRWNVVVFSENIHYLHEDAVFVPAERLRFGEVEDFIDRRVEERRTDVFEATRIILGRIPASNRPCNVFLISDGKATEGTSDVRSIVHDFQRVNRENFAIFTFNAGPGGNLYLLSLLSYRSRGRLGNSPEMDRVAKDLAQFCEDVNAPVLTNVVANYTNIRTSDVCPAVLPNLYRRHAITFWGRTTPGQEVALRVAGLSCDGPREFFFRTVVPAGDDRQPQVAQEWARGQAHELIARLGDQPEDKDLRGQILKLAAEYGLDDIRAMIEGKSWTDILPWKRK